MLKAKNNGDKNMNKASILTPLVSALFVLAPSARAQMCAPARIPANPAPVAVSSGSQCLAKILQTFGLNEEYTETLTLEQGKSYWFAANGCPRMGVIGLSIIDQKGTVLKQAQSYSPSFCYTASVSGKYTVKVKALSMMRSYPSGTIDACFSRSHCGD